MSGTSFRAKSRNLPGDAAVFGEVLRRCSERHARDFEITRSTSIIRFDTVRGKTAVFQPLDTVPVACIYLGRSPGTTRSFHSQRTPGVFGHFVPGTLLPAHSESTSSLRSGRSPETTRSWPSAMVLLPAQPHLLPDPDGRAECRNDHTLPVHCDKRLRPLHSSLHPRPAVTDGPRSVHFSFCTSIGLPSFPEPSL